MMGLLLLLLPLSTRPAFAASTSDLARRLRHIVPPLRSLVLPFPAALALCLLRFFLLRRFPLFAITVHHEDNASLQLERVRVCAEELFKRDAGVFLEILQRLGELVQAATATEPLQHVRNVYHHS